MRVQGNNAALMLSIFLTKPQLESTTVYCLPKNMHSLTFTS